MNYPRLTSRRQGIFGDISHGKKSMPRVIKKRRHGLDMMNRILFLNLIRFFPLVVLLVLWPCFFSYALDPNEVLVLANQNASESKGLAKFYMKRRGIPEKNLVLLFLTDKETCTRQEYEKKAVPPIRRFLNEHPQIRAIVTLFGVPLRISAPEDTREEKEKLQALETRKKTLEDQLSDNNFVDPDIKEKKQNALSLVQKEISGFRRKLDKTAAFDSELALVKKDNYELNMWIPNPYYLGFAHQKTGINKSEVLITSRLDGADETIVKRIITDSMEAEKNGLTGKAYFDARWQDPGSKQVSGYGFYDKSIHLASQLLTKENRIDVILNDSTSLFQKGEGHDAALYCGWYSLANYIDAFTWSKGSVGYHIASSECATLKRPATRVWCKKMLDKGIAATIGPIGEPYVQSFPVPEIFFNYLTEGYLSLAESYIISLPYLSWKMVLIGDPLYTLNLKK